jgi:preprotein translocase subunit YajC
MKKKTAKPKFNKKPLWFLVIAVIVIIAMMFRTFKPPAKKQSTTTQQQDNVQSPDTMSIDPGNLFEE